MKGTGEFPAHLWVVQSHYGGIWAQGKAYQMWAVDAMKGAPVGSLLTYG